MDTGLLTRREFGALLAAAACFAADRPSFFIQMSDPQFGMFTSNAGLEGETRNFERAISEANRLRPAFVIVTGDLVNRPADPAQVAEYKRIIAKLDKSIPLYSVPGNHDIGNECSLEGLRSWGQALGRDHYSFRSGSLYAIVLNTVLMSAPAECAKEAAEQEAWLARELATARRARARHVILFQHHPLFVKDPAEPDTYHNVPALARQRFLALLNRSTVSHVFAGHLHYNVEEQADRIKMVTTGPVGKPLGGAQSGLRIVKFGGSSLEHRYYTLEELPERIE